MFLFLWILFITERVLRRFQFYVNPRTLVQCMSHLPSRKEGTGLGKRTSIVVEPDSTVVLFVPGRVSELKGPRNTPTHQQSPTKRLTHFVGTLRLLYW